MQIDEAYKTLSIEARDTIEKEMQPDGLNIECSVYRTGYTHTLPRVGITLYVDGTWEYTNEALRKES
jgi:hypothetical protein